MSIIVVANPKGGVGKSTLATNVAGYLARRGRAVMPGDADRQQSSGTWLLLRKARCEGAPCDLAASAQAPERNKPANLSNACAEEAE